MSNIEIVDLEADAPSKKRSMGPSEERDGGDSAPPGEKAPRVAVAGAVGEAAAPTALGETVAPSALGETACGAGARGQVEEERRDGGRSEWRDIKLGSVANLRQRLEERSHEGKSDTVMP